MMLYDINGKAVSPSDGSYYSTEDKKQFPSYYGIDIDNGQKGSKDENGRDRVPPGDLSRLPRENLTAIFPKNTSAYYASTLTVRGDTNKQYNSSYSEVYVNDKAYGLFRFELSELPNNATNWSLMLNLNANDSNDTTWIVQDIPLEEITAEFIASKCTESVSATFIKAVSLASKSKAKSEDIVSLNGRVWLALGDSYTHLLGASYGDGHGLTPCTTGKWGELASQLGMTLYGYGISSSTIRFSMNTGSDGHSFQPMVSRVDTLIADHTEEADNVGLITFMGGLNDSFAETFLGDLKSVENTTIYGSCHQIFNKLTNAFPNAKIVVILQPVSCNNSPPADSEFSGMSDAQYCIYSAQLKQRIVKEVAEFYGITICDCCFDWYTTANPIHLSTIWSADLIHLSTLGNQKLTEKLIGTLEETFV